MGLLDTLKQVINAATASPQQKQAGEVLGNASPDALSQGLRETFDSKDTPAMGELVGQMFGQSNSQQQAGMLNQIVAALGPTAAAALAGGVLQKVMKPGALQVDEGAVGQLTPVEVSQVVHAAQEQKPDLSQTLSDFYAQHRSLIHTLGSAALLAAMVKIKQYSQKK